MKHLVTIVVVCAARFAEAEPAGAQAEILFREGQGLMARGKIAEACAAFDKSQQLDPTIVTLLNQANCREKNDQLATAWGLFLEAERKTRTGTDDATKQMHKAATDHAAKLEPRLSTLTITVADDAKIAGLEIVRDKESLEPVMWNKTLPIDGGTYTITARAPGNASWSTTITVANERDAKTIEIPRLKQADLGQPVTAVNRPAAEKPKLQQRPTGTRRASHVPLYVGGAAVVVLGAALTFELIGEATFAKTKTETSATQRLSLWTTANTERHAAQALAIAGVAGASVATWLYLRDRRERRVFVAPAVGGDNVTVQLVGGF